MSIAKNNCPVPFDQQPINEYLSLRQSWLFAWSISKLKSFLYGLIILSCSVVIVVSLLIIPFFSNYNLFKIFILDFIFSNVILFFVFVRIYLGWSYIIKRLLSATVFYEESGWYDGQVWVKTSDYLMQDRLIGLYEIMPFILRIKSICLLTILNLILGYLFYQNF
uniref:Ycf36 n=1 Tax=Digenea simplex TaxID=945030 RepID=A0A1Z1MV34_DIGSM|nr:hypothetical protein [Digenea simplex]ARW69554.1 hypothetical protein [Digenea simplex]